MHSSSGRVEEAPRRELQCCSAAASKGQLPRKSTALTADGLFTVEDYCFTSLGNLHRFSKMGKQ